MEFCKKFNGRDPGQKGMIIPVVITVYATIFLFYKENTTSIDPSS